MSTTINTFNANHWLTFLEKLPDHLMKEIVEFNPEHRSKMTPVFSSLLRYVYCPSYFHAAEEDILMERANHQYMTQELYQIGLCLRCYNYKEGHVLLKQLQSGIGFWLPDGTPNPSIKVNYCARCYQIQKRRYEKLVDLFEDITDTDTTITEEQDNDNDTFTNELFYDIDDDNDF
jgi:hypothetical protein